MTLPAPTFGHSIGAVFRLQQRRLVRGKRVWIGLTAVTLVSVAIVITRYAADVDPEVALNNGVGMGFFTLLVYLVPFLLCSGAISEEVEARTLAFLTSRPAPRSTLALGKYLAGTVYGVTLIATGILTLHLAMFATEPTLLVENLSGTARMIGGAALLTALYGAIAAFWGALLPNAAGVASVAYLGIVEFGIGFLPERMRYPSMNFWGSELAGLDRGGFQPDSVPELDPTIGLVPIGLELAIFLALTAVILTHSEFRFGKA